MLLRTPAARPPARLAATLAAAALTLGLAGCGGDETTTASTAASDATTAQAAPATSTQAAASSDAERTAAFRSGYDAQRRSLNAVTDRLGTALQTANQKTNAEIVRELSAIERDLGAGMTRLKQLQPPSALTADFGVATRTGDAIVGDLGDIVSAARTGDPDGAKRATQTLVGRIPTLQEATKKIISALGLKPSEDAAGESTSR